MKRTPWFKIGCLGLLLVLGLVFLGANEMLGTTSGDREIDGIKCGGMVTNGYHIHAHLSTLDRGNRVYGRLYPPNGIGSSQYGCMYWLHTHGPDGIIHIEAPKRITPTLGTFVDIWGQPLNRQSIATLHVERGETMRMYVNRSQYAGDPRAIPLLRHTTISIQIGPPFKPVGRYKFPHGL